MKKMFTKLFSTGLITAIMLTGLTVKAQTTSLTAGAVTVTSTSPIITTTTDTKAEVKPVTKTTADVKTEVKAEKKAAEDTSWKPQRRLWGYTFGDFYYNAHADNDFVGATGVPEGGAGALSKRGPETMYNGVAGSRNAFQFRRLYLGYDYEITKKFKFEALLASEPNANTGVNGTTAIQNGDNLVDGKMAFWIKNFNLRVRDVWNGTDFVIGEMSTPGFALNEPGTNGPVSLSEATWGYRSIEKTITDFHKNNSYDLGASLQGTFDPKTKNYGYVIMVGNNSQASLLPAGTANANTGFYKIFYGDLWAKFLNQKLYVDIYADYVRTAPATIAIPGQEHNMLKLFAAYNTKPISVGAELYTQKIASGVTSIASDGTKTPTDATVQGISFWVKGTFANHWNYFARYDSYNPDTDFNSADSYTVNTNYGSYNPTSKEEFYTAGIDYNPTKNVHFMPNFWLVNYKDQRASTTTGYVSPDHTLVFRFTFFVTFGK